jgi:UDP-glucose 4-epimerase
VAEVRRAETELEWKAVKTLKDCSVDVWNFTKGRCPDVPDEMQC